jgi:predicted alpha/beta hydrolase family esterase
MKISYFLLTKSVGTYLNILGLFAPKTAASKAFQLFCSPRDGKLDTNRLPQILEKATKKTIQFQGKNHQAYLWPGNSETILLLHGWESNAARWEKSLNHLQKTGKTIVAIDAPAHGLSQGTLFTVPLYADFIKTVIQTFNPQHIIAHSIGGSATIFYQYQHQNIDIKSLVILGAPSDLSILIDNFCKLISLNNRNKKHLINYFSEQFQIPVPEFSGAKFAKKITTSTFLAHDKNDNVVRFSEAQKLKENLTNIKFIETQNLGHSMHSDELYKEIINFLERKPNNIS